MDGQLTIRGNMKKTQFYVCPICGNIITAVGEGDFSCCGIRLPVQEAEVPEKEHAVSVENIDNEYFVTMEHPMSKEHYVSFISYVTLDSVEIVKLYPRRIGGRKPITVLFFTGGTAVRQEIPSAGNAP